MTRQEAGQRGGLATLAKHGAQHMAAIGKRGAATTWARYTLQPWGVAGWAMIDRATGKIKATR